MNLPTHETRAERYVTLLRERFGPDAASRVDLAALSALACNCGHEASDEQIHWRGCAALEVRRIAV